MVFVFEIIKNIRNNRRKIYPEPPIEKYNFEMLTNQCGGHELFHTTHGTKLDDVREFALALVPLKPHQAVLDIGCGRGELLYALAERKHAGSVVGIDLSEAALKISSETCAQHILDGRVRLFKMSASKLTFEDNSFDIVFMTDIVEHLSDEILRATVSECFRVLKRGGSLVVHTLPTVNYKMVGQYLVKYYFGLKGIKWWTPSSKEEAEYAGHINIQSLSSLQAYLETVFKRDKIHSYYRPVRTKGFLRRFVSVLNLWAIFSPHIWAVAKK